MPIGSILAAVAGPVIGGILGGSGGSSSAGNQTITNKTEIDPRMAEIIYGKGRRLKDGVQAKYKTAPGAATPNMPYPGSDQTNMSPEQWNAFYGSSTGSGSQEMINPDEDYINDPGLVGKITGLLDTPQKAGMTTFGNNIDDYMSDWGANNFMSSQQAAQRLQGSDINAPTAAAAQVNAPGQNDVNLRPAYEDMVYGAAGANPYLMGGIQKGINQSNTAFGNMMSDSTRNLMENVMPGIRSGARVSGSYGGNREGLAQGKALDSFNTQMGRAASQFGQNNTDAAVAAQAGAYDTDRNRSLGAMQGLGAQQYGVAGQNAQMQQQANLANQSAQLGTNQLNSANQQAGIGLSSGLLNNAYSWGANNDAYAGNQVGKVSGMLTPYTGLGGTSSQTQPLYQNRAAGVMGGAMMGQQLGRGFSGGVGGYNDEMARLNAQAGLGG